MQGVKEIGLRYFFKSFAGFFLEIGVTSASFYTLGRHCSLKEELRILVIGYARSSAYSFSNQLGTASGPCTRLCGVQLAQHFVGTMLGDLQKLGRVILQGEWDEGISQPVILKRFQKCATDSVRKVIQGKIVQLRKSMISSFGERRKPPLKFC